ncbi:hypothetical protein [Candidatus Mycoplasma haematohominis]|uniref:hypothetical protein n=1 Tax=Candidatus Mycoplasma haematohominis TaxID=1494318 RepID=UPI001C0A6FF7|nr:hypothetical protein [Candidatus Mycoplasma haemohominis]
MPVQTKAAAGTGIVVLVVGGGYGVSTLFTGMPDWKPFTENNLVSKYAYKTKAYFVGDTKDSDAWWDWSYKNRWKADKNAKKSLHHNFSNVIDGEDLKNKCVAVYKEDKGNVTSTYESGKYLESEVWRYCSPLEIKQKTIQETEEETYKDLAGSYGTTQKEKLISLTDPKNDLFWELKDQEFFGLGNYSTVLTDNSFDQSEDSLFHKFFKTKDKENREKIKDVCGKAYLLLSTSANTNEKVQQNTVIKFCSLEGN